MSEIAVPELSLALAAVPGIEEEHSVATAEEERCLGKELGAVGTEAVHQHHRRSIAAGSEPSTEHQTVIRPELDLLEARERPQPGSAILLGEPPVCGVEVATGRGHRAPADHAGEQHRRGGRDPHPTPVADRHSSGPLAQWLPRPLTTAGTVLRSSPMS